MSKPARTSAQLDRDVRAALAWLKKHSSPKIRGGMERFKQLTGPAMRARVRRLKPPA